MFGLDLTGQELGGYAWFIDDVCVIEQPADDIA